MKAHVFDVLTEGYKHVRVSCNIDILKMEYKDFKKKIVGSGKHNWAETRKKRNNIQKRRFYQ